jgi:hypothetical protein
VSNTASRIRCVRLKDFFTVGEYRMCITPEYFNQSEQVPSI